MRSIFSFRCGRLVTDSGGSLFTDEPSVLDYRLENPPEHYEPDPFRASDHDPILIGLFPDADVDGLIEVRDSCLDSEGSATPGLGGCDLGIPKDWDREKE